MCIRDRITGHNRAAAIVWPAYPEDRGLGIIIIDGNIRGNAHVGIDDKVVIRKAKSNAAVKITLAPTQPARIVGGEEYLMRFLEGRPVQKLSLIHISEPTRLGMISYAVFCLKKKKNHDIFKKKHKNK